MCQIFGYKQALLTKNHTPTICQRFYIYFLPFSYIFIILIFSPNYTRISPLDHLFFYHSYSIIIFFIASFANPNPKPQPQPQTPTSNPNPKPELQPNPDMYNRRDIFVDYPLGLEPSAL